jgi:hypothetical protein
MWSGAALIFLGIAACSAGRENVLSSSAPVAVMTSPPVVIAQLTAPAPNHSSGPTSGAKADLSDKRERPDNNHKADAALTAAAIAAIIVQTSRDQYHATGRPCACPDDTARNGSACGGRSAYSRPGGAAPLCYPTDVTATMIEQYRQKMAPR